MSVRALHKIVGNAIISDSFRAGILNGRRAQLLADFDLEPDERARVLAIRADTLADFAAAIMAITQSQKTIRSFFETSAAREGSAAYIGRVLNLSVVSSPSRE